MERNRSRETEIPTIPLEVAFYPEKATLLLKIGNDFPSLESKRLAAEQLGLNKKEEFHFTVIGNDTGKQILKSLELLDEEDRKQQLAKILELSASIKWKIVLKNDFYHIQKEYSEPDLSNPELTVPEKRESIIQMIEIEGLEEFYQKLNLLLNQQFSIPLPHVTLYTTSSREDRKLRGIGINSQKQFEDSQPKII